MKKLFMTDLDYTALGGFEPYRRIPDPYSRFLDRLSATGWDWAINSAWDVPDQLDLIQQSAVKSRPAFLIGKYGGVMYQLENETLRAVEPYTAEHYSLLLQWGRDTAFPLIHALAVNYEWIKISYQIHAFSCHMENIHRIENLPCVQEALQKERIDLRFRDNMCHVSPGKTVSKGMPVDYLREKFGYGFIACAGDGIPDRRMMEHAQLKLAPANAKPELKEFLRQNGGFIGPGDYCTGVIEAFEHGMRQTEKDQITING